MKKYIAITALLIFVLAATAFAHSASNRFWGEVPVDMMLSGDILIVKPLTIPVGVTLSIDRGATVRFEKTKDAGNAIIVRGALIVAGTKDAPVRFIPKDPGVKWKGIVLETGAHGVMNNVTIEGSTIGYGGKPPKGMIIKDVEVR